ncbi:unnamed protein product [Adineta steineri]|uniref:Sulfatase N-terminal domain-containing protein n=1 Tax=Adineta steineri TaxID=433720 RepID=A0A814B072_9BILA|nr:unnamed protein product [Adineta steineri]CAF4020566.1 unnamed protein product [Adineta steineri]
MMSSILTATHEPFLFPDDRSKLIHNFKSRKFYDEKLFIVVSDHGYVFDDHATQAVGLLRSPLESEFSAPLLFHSRHLQAEQLHANPGSSFITVKQYPRKLTYDITNDEVHLYHLQYDPSESIDLINLYNQAIDNHPSWIHFNHFKQIKYVWKGRWISRTIRISMFSQILSEKNQNNHWLIPKSVVLNNSKIDLDEMLNWVDRTFELTRLWTKLVFKRYRTNNPIDHQ